MHYVTFWELGLLIANFYIKKTTKVIFLTTVKPFHTKSEIKKPQANYTNKH